MIRNNLRLVEYAQDLDEDEFRHTKSMADEILDRHGRVIDNQISNELDLF